VGYRVTRAHGIQLVGRIAHPAGTVSPTIRRAVVVGHTVFTTSDSGVASSGLADLVEQGWAPFPAQPPVPQPRPASP
jgi:hypothetical protein